MVNNIFTSTFKRLHNNKRLTQFLILVSFLITFSIVRVITHLQRSGLIPNQNGPLHIHHLVPGIILLLVSGYIGISFVSVHIIRFVMAILFGIGSALTIDEFALWLFLKDVYWERQGRDSIDAVIITLVAFTIGFLISEAHDHYLIKKLSRKYKLL